MPEKNKLSNSYNIEEEEEEVSFDLSQFSNEDLLEEIVKRMK